MSVSRFAAAIAVAALSACANAAPGRMNLQPVAADAGNCDTAVASATMYSKASATHFARQRLEDQIGEVKSDLVTAGIPLARAGSADVQCEPYRIFGQVTSMHTCTAVARVCAR